MSSRTHFGVVDTAIKSMKTVQEYINVGMETTIDVAQDFVEYDKNNDKMINELKSTMLDYVKMERDVQQFMEAVDLVKQEASNSGERISMVDLLNEKVLELKQCNNDDILPQHEKYCDLVDKINEFQNPEEAAPQSSTSQGLDEDQDLAMTQQEVNTRCPYTGKDMRNPVKNKICGHNYDKEGIMHYIKQKGRKAKCPVGGCGNDKPVDASDLVENKELRKYIEKKARQEGKRTKRSAKDLD